MGAGVSGRDIVDGVLGGGGEDGSSGASGWGWKRSFIDSGARKVGLPFEVWAGLTVETDKEEDTIDGLCFNFPVEPSVAVSSIRMLDEEDSLLPCLMLPSSRAVGIPKVVRGVGLALNIVLLLGVWYTLGALRLIVESTLCLSFIDTPPVPPFSLTLLGGVCCTPFPALEEEGKANLPVVSEASESSS